jgi:hypothetical protein
LGAGNKTALSSKRAKVYTAKLNFYCCIPCDSLAELPADIKLKPCEPEFMARMVFDWGQRAKG